MADIRANIYLRKVGEGFIWRVFFCDPLLQALLPKSQFLRWVAPYTEGYCFVAGDVVKSSVRAGM